METTGRIEELWVVGGDVALDFVNTVDGEPAFDHLQSYGDLVAWGHRVGLISEEAARHLMREVRERPAEAETTHARALALRDVLYEIFRAIAGGERPLSVHLETLCGYESEALARATLAPDGDNFVWAWPDERDLGSVIYPVVHAAVELLTKGRLDRIKGCVACHWIFLDLSKNKSRRWCSMEVCGTNEKVRRYLSRRAAGREAT